MSLQLHQFGNPANDAIVFLHGLGTSSWMWDDQIQALQNRYYCVAIDLPGNGESHQVEWVSFAQTAASVADIIRQECSSGQAHVVGLSLGGYAALHLLANHPEVVRSTLVSGVTIRPFPRHYKPLIKLMTRIAHWDVVINSSAKMMQLPEEAAVLYRQDVKRTSKQTMNRVYDEVLTHTLPQSLTRSPQRLLAVAGDKEAKLVKESLADFTAVSHAVTALVPDAHHGWNGEHPQLFNEMIAAWVQERPLPPQLTLQQAPAAITTFH